MDIQLRVDNISDFVGSRRAVWRSYSGVGLFTQGLLATNLKLLTKRNIKAMASPGGSSICQSMTSSAITRVYTRSCCEIDTWLTTDGDGARAAGLKERKHLPDITKDSIFCRASEARDVIHGACRPSVSPVWKRRGSSGSLLFLALPDMTFPRSNLPTMLPVCLRGWTDER